MFPAVTVVEGARTDGRPRCPLPAPSARGAGISCRRFRATASGRTSARGASDALTEMGIRAAAAPNAVEAALSESLLPTPVALAAAHSAADHSCRPADQDAGSTRTFRMGGAIPVIPRVLRITHWTNEGAAFSLFADSASPQLVRWVLVGFRLSLAVAVLVALVRLGGRFTLTTVALALVFAGALGNVHDRIALRLGSGLHRGAHLQLPLAGLQRGRLLRRDRRLHAVAGFAAAERQA